MKSSTGQTLKVQGTDLRRHAESTLRKEQKTKIKNNSQSLNSFLHIDESFLSVNDLSSNSYIKRVITNN